MPDRVQGNVYRTTLVCVDESRKGTFSGRLYNPYWNDGAAFDGVMDFLLQMEDLLDQMKLPQSFTAKRSFTPPGPDARKQPMLERRLGRRATFGVRVLFRQNASWQGSVTWMETGREEAFRSVLELLLLMNSALPDQTNEKAKTGTCFSVLHSKTEKQVPVFLSCIARQKENCKTGAGSRAYTEKANRPKGRDAKPGS